MKQLLYFSAGLAIGGLVGWLATKKHYEKKADREIDEMRQAYGVTEISEKEYKEKLEETREMYDPDELVTEETAEDDEYIQYDDFPLEERCQKPYVIGPDLYSEDFHGFSKNVLVYWAGNDMLMDDNQEQVTDVEGIIGRESLEHFGEFESGTVFVRNERMGSDFEVLLEEGAYGED